MADVLDGCIHLRDHGDSFSRLNCNNLGARLMLLPYMMNLGMLGGIISTPAVKTGTGGIDPGEGLRRKKLHLPVKPTGLLDRPKAKDVRVQERLDESVGIQAEIAARLAREFSEEIASIEARPPVSTMSMAQIDAEIGVLLRKKLRTDEDEVIMLLLMIATSES